MGVGCRILGRGSQPAASILEWRSGGRALLLRACRSVDVSAVRCRACLPKHVEPVDDELSRLLQTALDMVVSRLETGAPGVAPRPRATWAQLYPSQPTPITGDVVMQYWLDIAK